MAKDKNYTEKEILEQLKKIQEEEDRLYGKQSSLPFELDAKGNLKEDSSVYDAEEESLLNDSEDPVLCKKLFYRLQSVINSNIKKGKIRDFVNNEKKLYLKSSSSSKDSRFSFKNSLNVLMDVANDWSRTDSNGLDLGMSFYDLNEKEGYHKPDKIKEANLPFDEALKVLLKTPPPKKDNGK